MKYRPEIDGLRAVAVMPVILFHAGIEGFSGGFVGVDVFFVISGYLITGLIAEDLSKGQFSLVDFYERRARRILPVLLLVVAVSSIFSYRWLAPAEFTDFSKSALWLSFFASNIYFGGATGYFDPTSEMRPLLHTWSLGVEEQFYVFFPILAILILRTGSRLSFGLTLSVIAIMSLAWSQSGLQSNPSGSFYLIHSRAWELLVGALCALWLKSDRRPSESNIFASGGLALIAIAVFAYDESTPFPGIAAIIPVMGSALVILFANPTSLVGAVLGARLPVGIGLLSYGAYLWHQPVFVFSRVRLGEDPSETTMLMLALISFGLAYLSWRCVENPFRLRGSNELLSRRDMFVAGAAGLMLMLAGSAYVINKAGLPNRAAPSGLTFAELSDQRLAPNYGLQKGCGFASRDSEVCRTAANPKVLLWGDSYTMHLAQAFKNSDGEVPFAQVTISQCAPIYGVAQSGSLISAEECIEFNDQVMDWLKTQGNLKYVVLSTPLTVLWNTIYDRSGVAYKPNDDTIIKDSLLNTVRLIHEMGKKVIIVSPTPANGKHLGRCLVHASTFGEPENACDFAASKLTNGTKTAMAFLKEVEPHVPVFSLIDLLCSKGVCHTNIEGSFVFRDWGHLSREGSEVIGRKYNLMGRVMRKVDDYKPHDGDLSTN